MRGEARKLVYLADHGSAPFDQAFVQVRPRELMLCGMMDVMTIKLHDWVEHTTFGVGQVCALRGDKLDIAFLNCGDKTLIISAPLQRATSPGPADGVVAGKRRKPRARTLAKAKTAHQ
jgi:hypothetical protein